MGNHIMQPILYNIAVYHSKSAAYSKSVESKELLTYTINIEKGGAR